jgi:hypothetical protein
MGASTEQRFALHRPEPDPMATRTAPWRAWLRLARNLAARHGRRPTRVTEAPMRAQLLSAEHMERQGRLLARAHKLRARPAPDRLLGRLSDNQDVIDEACALFTAAADGRTRQNPASDWVLDNP